MATVVWSESNLVGEIVQDNIANANFGSNDSYEIVTSTYPIVGGTNSFGKYLRVKFTGVFTTISNMLFWKLSGAYGVGELVKAAVNVTFVTPSQTGTGDYSVPITEGTALAVNSAEGAATIINGGSGVSGYTGYIRLQLQTTGSTPSGAVAQKVFCLQFDEV